MIDTEKPSNLDNNFDEYPMDEVYEFVGNRLRQLRTSKNHTQTDIAKLLGVSAQQYHKYEDGKSKCSLPMLLLLADYYEVPISSLIPTGTFTPTGNLADLPNEADLLARLVSAYVRIESTKEKTRIVQLVEAMQTERSSSKNDNG